MDEQKFLEGLVRRWQAEGRWVDRGCCVPGNWGSWEYHPTREEIAAKCALFRSIRGWRGAAKRAPHGGEYRFRYYKCKRAGVSGTCENYAVRAELIEEAAIEHFREVWMSPPGQKALRKAIAKVARQRKSEKPARLKDLESQLAKLEQQISRGAENLLLVDPEDVPGLKLILAGWPEQRNELQAAVDAERGDAEITDLDPNEVIAELEHLEERLTSDVEVVAKAAFGRVFKSITLFWKQVSPKRRELVRAEIETHFPFV